MGGAGFAAGLYQGYQDAQDRALQAQQLKIQQDMAKAQQKAMESEDQLKGLQLQSFMRKVEAEQRLPGMQAGLLGPEGAALGPGQQGPPVPPPPPEIDRRKLVTFLQTAAQAGQDPQQVLALMGVGDPRIKAIADSLLPETFEKLGEGDILVNKRTGEPKAAGFPKREKPTVVPAGGTAIFPSGERYEAPQKPSDQPKPIVASPGQVILLPDGRQVQIPAGPQKPVAVGPGQQLVDPSTGQPIYSAPPEQPRPVVVPPGASMVTPGQSQPAFTAPPAPQPPQKPMAVSPGQTVIDPTTGQPIYSAPAAEKEQKPLAVSPGQTVIDPSTGQPIYSAPPGQERPVVVPPGASMVMPGAAQASYTAPPPPEKPQKPIPVSPGQTLVDPETGLPMYQAPAPPERPSVVPAGGSLVMPGQKEPSYTAPTAPRQPVSLSPGQTLVQPETGKQIFTAPAGPGKPMTVSPGQFVFDPVTGSTVFTAPGGPGKQQDYGDRLESAAAAWWATKHGRPGNFWEMLQEDPLAAEKLQRTVMYDQPLELARARMEEATKAERKKLLTTSEAKDLGVPFGTTKGEAEGIMPIPAQAREALAGYDTARTIIADIKQYSEKVNTAAGGLKGKAQQSMKLWGAWTQSDPDAAMLASKAGELASIARSLGEKGALANQDVARAAGLVPGVLDTREVAVKKLQDMNEIINRGEANYRKSLGIDARTPPPKSPRQPKPQVPDPMKAIPVPPGLSKRQEEIYRKTYMDELNKKRQQMQGGTNAPPAQ